MLTKFSRLVDVKRRWESHVPMLICVSFENVRSTKDIVCGLGNVIVMLGRDVIH